MFCSSVFLSKSCVLDSCSLAFFGLHNLAYSPFSKCLNLDLKVEIAVANMSADEERDSSGTPLIDRGVIRDALREILDAFRAQAGAGIPNTGQDNTNSGTILNPSRYQAGVSYTARDSILWDLNLMAQSDKARAGLITARVLVN